MALVNIEKLSPDVSLGLWKITESTEEFLSGNGLLQNVYDDEICNMKSEARRKEKLAVYSLLYSMTDSRTAISHDDNGKPIFRGYNISISHTRGYAAVIISKCRNVAVDIEYRSNRVSRIIDKFIRQDEQRDSVEIQLINWCAKETVYKYFSSDDLKYFEMRLHQFCNSGKGEVTVDNLRKKKSVVVKYCVNSDYVLTYTY